MPGDSHSCPLSHESYKGIERELRLTCRGSRNVENVLIHPCAVRYRVLSNWASC